MTDQAPTMYGDPLTQPFWQAAERHVLMIQHCADCGHDQFYPRPFCMQCESDHVEWVESKGKGVVYASTTVPFERIHRGRTSLPSRASGTR